MQSHLNTIIVKFRDNVAEADGGVAEVSDIKREGELPRSRPTSAKRTNNLSVVSQDLDQVTNERKHD